MSKLYNPSTMTTGEKLFVLFKGISQAVMVLVALAVSLALLGK